MLHFIVDCGANARLLIMDSNSQEVIANLKAGHYVHVENGATRELVQIREIPADPKATEISVAKVAQIPISSIRPVPESIAQPGSRTSRRKAQGPPPNEQKLRKIRKLRKTSTDEDEDEDFKVSSEELEATESDPDETDADTSQVEPEEDQDSVESMTIVDQMDPAVHRVAIVEGEKLWLVDRRAQEKVEIRIGGHVWVSLMKTSNVVQSLSQVATQDFSCFQAVVKQLDFAKQKVQVQWFYTAQDLIKIGFPAEDFDGKDDEFLVSSTCREYQRFSSIRGVGTLKPTQFKFYHKTKKLRESLNLNLKPIDNSPEGLAEDAILWASLSPDQESESSFFKKIIVELSLLTNFGQTGQTREMLGRLAMIPHTLAPERGLTPAGFRDWTVDEKLKSKTKGKCVACGSSKNLSWALKRKPASSTSSSSSSSSSSRTGPRLLLGTKCRYKICGALRCSEALSYVREVALALHNEQDLAERLTLVADAIREFFKILTDNRHEVEKYS
jgi:predicted  nucleic acid-binding Zn-ribbon protein